MIFSSTIFLFYFLPLLLLFYFLAPGIKAKNFVLLLFSFIFFFWGGVFFTLILLCSIVFNYFVGQGIEKSKSKTLMFIGISGNLILLIWFKYAGFLVDNLNSVLNIVHSPSIILDEIILPIGISFYTFHSISYLIDVYYKRSPAQKNILDMALYIVLFSQLVAGPIIRYRVFAPQLLTRKFDVAQFSNGVERFIIGLAKKVLIANTLARLADESFHQNPDSMSMLLSWAGALCYTFQIYFDFSGYSDMAIGLSKLFGFEFPENFNLPYIATSIKDFWKRWHISLSSFFRDYVYIELGGNRKGKLRTLLNLSIVFLLTGFWHGANYTFIVWGIIHGSFLLFEKLGFEKILLKIPSFFQRSYTFIIVLLAWIPFRADSMAYAVNYWKSLFNTTNDMKYHLVSSFFTTDLLIALVLAIFLSFNLHKYLPIVSKEKVTAASLIRICFLFAILFFSAVYLMSGTYNPFIYYQF